jgi:tetratricopeptide (TPR) repeat protein
MDECPACGKAVSKGVAVAKIQPAAGTQTLADAEDQKYAAEAVACRKRGKELRENEDYEGAIREFSRAIKLEPDYTLAYGGRGLCYTEKENWHAAIRDYSKAIDIFNQEGDVENELLAEFYNFRGIAFSHSGDWGKAISDFDEACRLAPDDETYAKNLEIVMEEKGGASSSGLSYDEESNTLSGPCPHCERTAIFRGQGDNDGLVASFATGVGIGVKALFNPIKAVSGLGSLFGVTNNDLAGVYICSACRRKVVYCDNCKAMVKFDEKINGMAVCRNCGNDCGITS